MAGPWMWICAALAAPFADADRVVFTDKANLRAAPDTDAEVVAELPLGTDVDVLETGVKQTLWGRSEPWLKVKAGDHEGWIWAGLLTDRFVAIGRDGDGVAVGIRGVGPSDTYSALVSIEVGARVDGRVLEPARADLGVPVEWSVQGVPFDVQLVKATFDEVEPVVRLRYSQEYCGGLAGNMVWARHGEKMVHLGTFAEGSDAPMFFRDGLIFPGEADGRPGVVLRRVQGGEYLDEGGEHYEQNRTTEHRVVDGRLVPPVSP